MIRHPPRSPLFPTPTLSRSRLARTRPGVHRPAQPARQARGAGDPALIGPPPTLPAEVALDRIPERLGEIERLREPTTSAAAQRSEEHTSELQSPCNLVCRLL